MERLQNVERGREIVLEELEDISKAHRSYFQEWKKHHRHTSTSCVFNEWREWARPNIPECWINAGFIWRSTDNKYDYWYKISRAWFIWYKQNIKK